MEVYGRVQQPMNYRCHRFQIAAFNLLAHENLRCFIQHPNPTDPPHHRLVLGVLLSQLMQVTQKMHPATLMLARVDGGSSVEVTHQVTVGCAQRPDMPILTGFTPTVSSACSAPRAKRSLIMVVTSIPVGYTNLYHLL
jgi:hypothetical protein